jgi:phage major head subunit gpT-like protein
MLITQATLNALRVQFELRFSEAYGATEPWWPQLATEIPSAAKSNVYGWLAQQILLREWVGPRQAQNLSEHSYTLANKSYEATIELDRDEIEDDNLGVFTAVAIPQLAQGAKKHTDQLIRAMLQSNAYAGPLGFDGLSLFHDSHPTFDSAASTYDNDFDLDLTADNFNTNWAAMASYTGEDGEPLGIMPNLLIVPPQLKRTALEIMNGTLVVQSVSESGSVVGGAAIDNALKGWANVLVIPELANAGGRWYLADVSKPLKPLIYQNRRPDEFVTRDAPNDPKVFDQKKFTYGVDNRKNVGVSLPFLISTSSST